MGNEKEVLGDFVVLPACSRRADYKGRGSLLQYMFHLKNETISPSNTSLRGFVPANLHLASSVQCGKVSRLLA